jgi:hypothetical protein
LGAGKKILTGVMAAFGTLLAIPTLLWAGIWIFGFIDRYGEKCNFASLSDAEYKTISSGASAQSWTVWPGLSNGVFFSSRGEKIGRELILHIGALAGSGPSSNRQLASAHAILRGIGAEYVRTLEVPRNAVSSTVSFGYYLPQVRFAPACVFCLVWWYTTIDVIFSHELATDRYEFQAVNVLHAQLKYDADKQRARNVPWGSCPAFPR